MQDNNITHRDIKPQNILVFNKVAEFGEAIEVKEKENLRSE
jgi:serine/threonine protein kinase